MDIRIKVRCSDCWSDLDAELTRNSDTLDVKPCKHCTEETYETGRRDGEEQ